MRITKLLHRLKQLFTSPARKRQERQLLWNRIQAFDFNTGYARGFIKKLAEEEAWTPEFAQRAVEEYRRFMFLARTAGHAVVPSLVVDQVWHVYCQYQLSYLNDFCLGVLGELIYHQPGSGTEEENVAFIDGYQLTLSSYRKHFGEPPEDIWGENNGNMVRKKRA